jgi:multiple sugar transport system permease protein
VKPDRGLGLALRYLAAFVALVVFLFPIYWLFAMSLKTAEEIFAFPPVWWPSAVRLENYLVLFRDGDAKTIGNSLVIALVSTLAAMFFGTLCAYSIARFRTGGDNFAMWILSNRMLPPIVIVFPVFLLYVRLGWVDTYLGLIILYTAFNLPYVIWMMRGYIQDIPLELEESALVDGCTRWGVFRKVVLPMARSGIFATAVFTFVFAWNEFLFALVLSGDHSRTMPVAASTFVTSYGTEWGYLAALGSTAMIPTLLFILFVQRHLVRGLTLGGLRE